MHARKSLKNLLLMMAAAIALILLVALSLAPFQRALAASAAAQATPSEPAIEPEAMAALDRMGAYLRTLQNFEIESVTTLDDMTDDGQKLQFGGKVSYQVKRPDAFVIKMTTDRKVRTLYYDGKTLTMYAPRMQYYASVPAPGTIHQVADTLRDDYGIELPLDDLFSWGTPDDNRNDITSAFVVGYADIGGADTDQYAFRQGAVDWQVWIQRGPQPLPRKIVITSRELEGQPEYAATLTWNTTPNFTPQTFAFTPPPEAKAIKLAKVGDQ